MNLRRLVIPLGALLFTGCFEVASKTCTSGLVCPIGSVCSGDGSNCISSTALCGNGVVDTGEKCDDGNIVNGDSCRFDCKGSGTCGDGTLDAELLDLAGKPLEVCDDGNLLAGDGCNAQCKEERCGNGIVDVVGDGGTEPCDDGNTVQGDGCRSNCTLEVCGDGLRDVFLDGGAEECDFGDLIDGDDCSSKCKLENCGNDIVDVLRDGGVEECDNDTGACGLTCLVVRCGNGQRDDATSGRGQGTERCDDGNRDGGDGCNPQCSGVEVCGDRSLDPVLIDGGFEVCDDGNVDGGDGCSADCRSNETCGNGITDTIRGELCDDGALVSGDGCRQDCRGVEVCGDNFRDTVLRDGGSEQCDDGNLTLGDGCSATCRDEVCGNGITDTARGELCDDNNQASGDGCRQDCRGLEVCGDNVRDAVLVDGGTEQCDDGNQVLGDGCSTTCRFEVCGNGITDSARGELCDDGNTLPIGPNPDGGSADNCSSDCRSTGTCGNGTVESGLGEQCDNAVANSNTAVCTSQCRLARCGDTFTYAGVEQCDDGVESLTCNVNCTNRRCGDGIINATAGEQCDVFGAVTATETATCDTDCTAAFCGDSKVNLVLNEQCDTGGNSNSCNANCRPAICGDSILNPLHGTAPDGGAPFEQCDTGGNSTFCDNDCSPAVCGDGFFNSTAGEQCDDGNAVNNDNCVSGCRSNTCGDGFRDEQGPSTEACDDGNQVSETTCAYGLQTCPGCAANCGTVLALTGPYCGDNAVNGPEVCDDGNTTTETTCPYGGTGTCTGCTANCAAQFSLTGPRCGDGVVNGTGLNAEVCDDGNAVTEANCPYGQATCTVCAFDCKSEPARTGIFCGDNITNGGEVCDDGNTVTESTCAYGTASCTACTANCGAQFSLTGPRCGDNVVNGTGGDAEVCDDGNTSTEANCPYGTPNCTVCASDCKSQPARTGFYCGDNLTNGPESCDDGNAITESSCNYGTATCNVCNAGCTALLPRTGERCGDGVVNGSGPDLEICDDGNTATEGNCPYGQSSCTLCDATCDTPLSLTGNVCGDGVVNAPDEQCDDRNTLSCGTCNANCTVAQAPLEATGTIRTVSDGTLNDNADGQSFTLFDGVNAGGTTFCFKLNSSAFTCPAGTITLDFEPSGVNPNDEGVADAVIAAINGVGATLQITASKRFSNPWVRLTNDNLGGQGNIQMTDTVVSGFWQMTGMSGGGAADCVTGTACVTGNDCVSGTCSAPADGGVISTCD